MAYKAFSRAAKGTTYKISEMFAPKKVMKQDFRNLLILDFEATCDDGVNNFQQQEIIEFPCVALSTEDWTVKDVFHQYVQPKINPELTTFCTDLTGIIQETVDNQPHFPQVFDNFHEWLEKGEYLTEVENP